VSSGRSQYLTWAISLGTLLMAPGAAAVEPASISEVKDLPKAATTVQAWMAQVEAATVRVSAVRLERTETGLEIVLETTEGNPLQVDPAKFRAEGNSLIAEIPNTVLALPEAAAFTAENPTPDIANVQVVQQDGSTIQVIVAGKEALPQTAVTLKTGELTYSLNPKSEEPEEELVVTGETQEGYRAPNTSVGTRTDTPLRDIPQSIQVVPQQVIQDTQSRNLAEALENVPGVLTQGAGIAFSRTYLTIRGFENYNGLVNGLPDPQIFSDNIFFNVERIEALKGPAAALYGDGGFGNIGGTVNYVTRRPLKDPFFEAEATVGNNNFYEGTVDISGPLNASKSVLGRFITGYRSDDSFVDFNASRAIGFAPSLGFQFGSKSNLIIEGDLTISERDEPGTLPVEHQILFGVSLSRSITNFKYRSGSVAPVDIFNPVYDQTVVLGEVDFSEFATRDVGGVYVQNQVTLLQNLKLLVGGRFDVFEERKTDRLTSTETMQSDTAFSPRAGLVYQPIRPISLYASYSRYFNPVIGSTFSGAFLVPERGTQYEVGIKADLTSRLSTTLAFYDLTRTNVTTTDPENPDFSVQSGKQRSRGIELDISGEILPGWNIIAGYAYTDARIVEDNDIPTGNRLYGAPEHAVNLWTTYRIQSGAAKGLGFGLGLY
jgi:outer membrane receptor protein involved in Fe transport